MLVFVSPAAADTLTALRTLPEGSAEVRIGEVTPPDGHPGRVIVHTTVGARRVVDMPVGEQLPRIC